MNKVTLWDILFIEYEKIKGPNELGGKRSYYYKNSSSSSLSVFFCFPCCSFPDKMPTISTSKSQESIHISPLYASTWAGKAEMQAS
jgi:hypothetical protein